MSRCSSRPTVRTRKRRNGFSIRGLLIGLAVLAGAGGVVWYTFPSLAFSSKDTGPMLHTVALGDFVHDITERGNVESASNIEIRCEVESRGSQGTMILELIDEGTYVKPGDVLCKLDSSSLEQDLVQQQIVCNTSEAAVIQARNNYETAVIAKEEYLKGTYAEEKLGIEGNIFVAEEGLRQARQQLDYTQKLFARGYVTNLAVEADTFSVQDAEKKLEQAQTELDVLEKYKKVKTLKQLDADIKTTEAKLKSEEHSYGLDLEKLEDIKEQIAKCTIVAPDHGQVVYANVTDRRGGSEIIIEEGGSIRERQVIFRLPDPNRMQVKANINEASVSMVESGMAAGIRLDAFPDLELKGEVAKVNEYPVPTSFFSGNVKEYETTIRIHLPGQEEEEESPATDGAGPRRNGKSPPELPSPKAEPKQPAAADTAEPKSPSEAGDSASPAEPAVPDAASEGPSDPATSPGESAENDADQKTNGKTGGGGPMLEKPDASGEKVQLRPGMTAEVKIRVQTIPNVLQVPVQAIVEHGGKNYCLLYDKATGWSKREVKVGSTNDKTVVIREGLSEGEKVVMGAAKHREKVTWPKLENVPGVTPGTASGEQTAMLNGENGSGGQRSGQGRGEGGGEGRGQQGGEGGGEGRGQQGGEGGGEGRGQQGGGPGGPPDPAQAFGRLDANSDGKLSEDEVPPPMKSQFSSADKNGDGGIDLSEFSAVMRSFGRGRPGGRGEGGAGGPGGGGPGGGGPGGGGPGGGGPRPGGPQ